MSISKVIVICAVNVNVAVSENVQKDSNFTNWHKLK